ncbi:c-type cytochrome domain-containing protein [Planctomycetaceae bacterium SH139]
MKKSFQRFCQIFAFSLGLVSASVHADGLSDEVFGILSNRCHSCHGVELKHEKLNVLEHSILIGDRGDEDKTPYVTPGNLEESKLWQVIVDEQMPPKQPLPAEEQEKIKEWILAGAVWTTQTDREFISETDVLRLIERDLSDRPLNEQQFQRYFSITHLHNNGSVPDRDLRIYRAALSKALNSMSDRPKITLPVAINDESTIFRIDLRDYGWTGSSQWQAIQELYPYGLKPLSNVKNDELFTKILRIYGDFSGVRLPYLRADWFVATATRPPLYHELAKIPEQLDDLVERLSVDIEGNFQQSSSRRVGLFESGVSGQNRMIEYLDSSSGRFWLSYDFLGKSGRSNLALFPLGPEFEGNTFNSFAFEHAGGEIIYELPNGLHGYMLIDGEGERIDAGPIEIVWDALNVSGSPLIVNGLSCMSCHRRGILPLEDFVRNGATLVQPNAMRKVRELYPPQSEINEAVADSSQRYIAKLRQTIGSFVDLESDPNLEKLEEPVSRVALLYAKSLDLEAIACELGLENTADVQSLIKREVTLGLGPIGSKGGTVKRSYWESQDGATSVLQDTAEKLKLGSAVVF